MSALHGRCSLGAPVCAALGTTLTSAHVTPATHLPGTGVTVLFTGLLALSGFPHRLERAGAATGRPRWRPVLLLVPGFFSAFVEGAVSDWNAVYLNGWKHAGHGLAVMGFVAFSDRRGAPDRRLPDGPVRCSAPGPPGHAGRGGGSLVT